MRDAQRAIDSVAVSGSRPVAGISRVTPIAHVVSAKAVEDSDRTAEHALPIYLSLSVCFTDILASSYFFQDTVLAS